MTSSWSRRSESSSAAAALLAAAGVAAVIRGDVSARDGHCIWADAVCSKPLAACEQKSALAHIEAAMRMLRSSDAEAGAGEPSISRDKGPVEIAWCHDPGILIGFAACSEGSSRFVALWQPDAGSMSLARHKDLLRVAICYEIAGLRRSRTASSAAFTAKIAAETLNRLAIPLFVLGRNREIVRMNSAARAWLRSDGRLRLSNRTLIGASAVLNAQLRMAIGRVTGASPDLAIMPLVDETDSRPAVTLSCAPMPEPRDHVLIAIQERRCDLNLAQQTLTALGLTQAERRLASFMATGMSLQKAASTSGITFSTARSYLKRIFGKLGIARQSDLVGLVAALTPVFMSDDAAPAAASGMVPDFAAEAEGDGSLSDGEAALTRRARHDIHLVLADSVAGDSANEPAAEPYR